MSFFAAFSPAKRKKLAEQEKAMDAEIQEARGSLNNTVQSVQSGARVMDSMAGMMRILSMTERLDRE